MFRFSVEEQKIVGAIKSLESLGEVIKTEIYQVLNFVELKIMRLVNTHSVILNGTQELDAFTYHP